MVKMFRVKEFINSHKATLALELVAGEEGLSTHHPKVEYPVVLGTAEMLFFKELPEEKKKGCLPPLLKENPPFVVVADGESIPEELSAICTLKKIPLFHSSLLAFDLISKMSSLLFDDFAPMTTCHGTFIEAFGVGVLIQGDSSIGKSEAALGLIERGHRLVSDDVVKLRLRKDSLLEGFGPELTRHMMELRGIGIINVAHLFGAVCVRDAKSLDVIVRLEEWSDQVYYDRVGLDERYTELLGVNIPSHTLPVKPGRDVVLLIETIVLNHRLKVMGYHSAKEFNVKLLDTIAKKQRQKARIEK